MDDSVEPTKLPHERNGPPLCVLACGEERWPGRTRRLSAAGAFVETVGRPPLGSFAALAHPDVGAIAAKVAAHAIDGVSLSFELTEESTAFALSVAACDMTVSPNAYRDL